MQVEIDPKRLAEVTALHAGSHSPGGKAMCAMELVAWIAHEPWSAHPECASPVIGAFMRSWNDSLPDEERTALLLPLIPRLVGTRGSRALEHRRALMAADWLVREHTPAWLRLAGLTAQADALAGLPEITNMAQAPSIKPAIEAARKDAGAAWGAVRAAAGDAAGAAVWAAAGAADWAADWDADWAAAWAAAWVAVRAAVRVAVRAAVRAAAGAVLKPTRDALQQSALRLVERMIAANDNDGARAAA